MFQSHGTSSQHRMAKEQLMELGVMYGSGVALGSGSLDSCLIATRF